MRICKLDKTEQIWGRGGPASGAAGGSAAAAATSNGNPAAAAANAGLGTVAGAGAGLIGFGPTGTAFIGAYVTDTLNNFNAANPPSPTFGITVTDTMCLNPAYEANRAPTDPLGNPQGGYSSNDIDTDKGADYAGSDTGSESDSNTA